MMAGRVRNGMSNINLWALAFVLYLLPVQSLASVRFGERTETSGRNITSLGSAHAITGSNTYLVCGIIGDSGTLLSATYGSVAMTRKNSAKIGKKWVEVWELAAPGNGSKPASFTFSELVSSVITNCLSFTGVDQRSPSGRAGRPDTGRNGRLSVRIIVPKSGAGVSFGFNADTTACGSQKSDQTSLFDFCDDDKSVNVFSSTTAAAGPVSMTWTLSGRNDSGLVAFPLNPAVTNVAGGFK